ncbi:zinc finger protein 571-like isoform X1 [Gigantopelta aegis]|uniref:zinc finger protein 571-like isoform X1 n=1 Tax=Gigantopelta aegis TaxID=1735272 RepID=UPI001B88D10D|nr:zinc finger protein 571-like isoform X1 [Gigantopelta aegis]
MDDNNLSAFLEKVNGVETAFTLLVCSERECAVTSLETLLNKLKCLLKVKELTNNKQKCIKSEHGEEENNKTSTELDTRPRKRRSNRTACSQTSKQTTRSKIPKLAPKEKENKIKEEISVQDSSNARTRKKRNSLQKNNLVSIATRRSGRGTKKKAVADVDSVTHEDQSGINDTVDSEIDENDVDHHPLENSTTPVLENRVTSSRSRGASSQRRLSRHLVNNSKDTDELSLEETRTSTTNKRVHKCKKCGESFTSNHLMKSHFRVHGLSSLACRFCRKVMMNEVALLHHKCAETRRKRTCRICGDTRQFETFSDLREHMRMEHDKLSTPGDAIHTCSYCPRTFSRKVALFMHLKVHAGNQFVCLKCGLFLEDKDAYASHMTEHYADAQFRCQICKSSFRQQRLYYSHMDNHQKYDCKDCSRPFTCWRDLRRHRKIEHGEKYEAKLKSYECEDCHRKFLKENQLEIHRRIHTGERPLQCSLCQLFFRTQKALHKHKQTYKHSLLAGDTVKERKYLCSQCGKAYFRKQALQRHLKQHTGEKNFNCGHCGYRCHEVNNLKRHIALHFEAERKFICEVCGAAFHAKKTLEMHHRYKHSEERAHCCPECPLSFKARNALKRHIKVHERNKDHRCWCGAAFNRLYNLRRHLRSVHNDDSTLPPVRKVEVLDADSAIKVPYGEKSKPAPKIRVNKMKKAEDHQVCPELPKPLQDETLVCLASSTLSTNITAAPPQNPMVIPMTHEDQQEQQQQHQQQQQEQQQQQQNLMVYDHMTAPPAVVAYQPAMADPARLDAFDSRVQNVAQDYYNNANMLMGMNLEHAQNDYNNPFMYIQNILLPSVAMAGLLDLSQGHQGGGTGGKQ